MAKFHISDSGEPKRCIARPGNCKYRDADGGEVEHYGTKEEAREAYERSQEQEIIPTFETVESAYPFRSVISHVPDLKDVVGEERTQEKLRAIREHMTTAVLTELRSAPEGSQGYYYSELVDQHERGEIAEGQFANLAIARAGSAVAGASRTVRDVVERNIYESHLAAMREDYANAIGDVGDLMEQGSQRPLELEGILERSFLRNYGAGAKPAEERAELLAAARRELQIFGPIWKLNRS